jgi:hypothetical protein
LSASQPKGLVNRRKGRSGQQQVTKWASVYSKQLPNHDEQVNIAYAASSEPYLLDSNEQSTLNSGARSDIAPEKIEITDSANQGITLQIDQDTSMLNQEAQPKITTKNTEATEEIEQSALHLSQSKEEIDTEDITEEKNSMSLSSQRDSILEKSVSEVEDNAASDIDNNEKTNPDDKKENEINPVLNLALDVQQAVVPSQQAKEQKLLSESQQQLTQSTGWLGGIFKTTWRSWKDFQRCTGENMLHEFESGKFTFNIQQDNERVAYAIDDLKGRGEWGKLELLLKGLKERNVPVPATKLNEVRSHLRKLHIENLDTAALALVQKGQSSIDAMIAKRLAIEQSIKLAEERLRTEVVITLKALKVEYEILSDLENRLTKTLVIQLKRCVMTLQMYKNSSSLYTNDRVNPWFLLVVMTDLDETKPGIIKQIPF